MTVGERGEVADNGGKPRGYTKNLAGSSHVHHKHGKTHAMKVWMLALVVVIIPSFIFVTWAYNRLPVVLSAAQVPPEKFSEDRARRHIHTIVEEIGTRQGGSIACEQTKEYILKQIDFIKNTPCKFDEGCATLEVDVQISKTGAYYVDFMDHIINNIYTAVPNIVVRVSNGTHAGKEHAVLINGHYDTGLASPGAGDNAAAVSAMIEMVRAMASQPAPPNSAVFLFNGAEESLLQASHAFVSSHPWAKTIRAAINIEGAGSGGPDILFQSTSGALVHAYSAAAPYPHGSVLGEELFATGAIPSDTDFRIFRDIGQWPALDIAYYRNGFVYHTPIDDLRFVNPGSIQHLGDNVLGVVRHLVFNVDRSFDHVRNSSLSRPVYFDLFGFFVVLYSREAMVALNWATLCLAIVTFWQTRPKNDAPPLQIMPLLGVFGSVGAALAGGVVMAIFMMIIKNSLSWYAQPLLGFALYSITAFWCMIYVQYRVRFQSKSRGINKWRMERDVSRGVLLLWSVILAFTTLFGLGSSYYGMIWSLCMTLHLLLSFWFHQEGTSKTDSARYSWRVSSLLPITFGFCVNLYTMAASLALFFPIMGRCGAETPAEIVIAILISATSAFTWIALIPVVHWGGHLKRVLKIVGVILLVVFAISLFISPYDTVKPKRIAIQHTTFYPHAKLNVPIDQSLEHENHMLLIHVDPVNLDSVFKYSKKAGTFPPNMNPKKFSVPHRDLLTTYPLNSFMGGSSVAANTVNLTVPILKILKNSYDSTKDVRTLELELDYTGAGWSAIKFSAPLVAWSLGDTLPPAPQGHYFVRHIGGYGITSWKIELQIQGNKPFDVHACVTNFDYSEDIRNILKIFPPWTVPIAFQSVGAVFRIE